MGRRGLHPAAVARTTSQARRARPLGDRLAVRSPVAFSGMLRFAFARPPGSRLRGALLRSAFARSLAAFNRRDYEVNTLAHDPSFRLRFGTATDRPAGALEEYRGVDGLLDFLDLWFDVWGDYRFRFDRFYDAGPSRVVLVVWQTATARDALRMDEHVAVVMEFAEGRLVEQTFWRDPQAALASEAPG